MHKSLHQQMNLFTGKVFSNKSALPNSNFGSKDAWDALQKKRQLRFDTEKITVCKRSVGWKHKLTRSHPLVPDTRPDGNKGMKRRFTRNSRSPNAAEWWPRSFHEWGSLLCHAPVRFLDSRWAGSARNVGPFRAKRIISV